jgi:nucleotide-binding universal stress UspA family protein
VPLKSSRKDVSTYVNVRQVATASAGVFLAEAESTRMNEMTKKVLCAVDDSEHSKIAVAVAGELAKATGAELTLLAVNAALGIPARGGIAYAWEDSDLKRILDSASAIAKKAGVSDPKTVSAKSRDVARAIVVYAEDNDIDHIVVGTGGKGGVARLVLGSVSQDVIGRAHCRVTVAR